MKNLILLAFVIVSNISFGQSNWTSEQIQVLDKYGLTQNDPRGIVFYTGEDQDCTDNQETVLKAIEAFFTTELKSDLTYFCVPQIQNSGIVKGQAMDLFQIVSVYLIEVTK